MALVGLRTDAHEETPERASRRARFAGAIVDGAINWTCGLLIPGAALMCVAAAKAPSSSNWQATATVWLFGFLAGALVIAMIAAEAILVVTRGQTVGKIVARTRIVLIDGTPAGAVPGLLLRSWTFRILGGSSLLLDGATLPKSPLLLSYSILVGLVLLADPLFIFRRSRRCLHDLLAGTIVVTAPRDATALGRLVAVLGCLAIAMLSLAQWLIFVSDPADIDVGINKLFYVHVPLQWGAFACFIVVAVASIGGLWASSREAGRLAVSSAEVGVFLGALALGSGMLWSYSLWGAVTPLDARLMMTACVSAIYGCYLGMRASVGSGRSSSRYVALLGVVGVPLSRLSVGLFSRIGLISTISREGGFKGPVRTSTLYFSALAVWLLAAWLASLRSRRASAP